MTATTKCAIIQSIVEILVDCGMYPTERKASNAVTRGDISVGGTRVANAKALLVIVSPVVISNGVATIVVGQELGG